MTNVGIPWQNPTSYTGPKQNIVPLMSFPRRPTTADKIYPVGQFALLSKSPSTGLEGELWYLKSFVAGVPQWILLATGSALNSVTTDSAAPPVLPDVNGNINLLGGVGCNVTGNGPGHTATVNVTGGGFDWTVVTAATQALTVNNGYLGNRGSAITYTLPSVAAVGDVIKISNFGAGLPVLAQNAGQTVHFTASSTTTGVGGSLTSVDQYGSLTLVCCVANTGFIVIEPNGNWTIV